MAEYDTPVANSTVSILEMDLRQWDDCVSAQQQVEAARLIESGGILFLPALRFDLADDEPRFLSERWADPKSKNISFDAATGTLRGARGTDADIAALREMIRRYADRSRALISALFPAYVETLTVGRTSFRPVPAANREGSWRKDDRLLHVDAFASRPNRGARILRVFNNINPFGEPRIWRVGEAFDRIAAAFLPRIPAQLPGQARLLAALGITKAERSGYDHIMLKLHDLMKADSQYQRDAPRTQMSFPSNSTWICFSDQVPHAVVGGQYLLEHTALLPVNSMHIPERSPLRILEGLVGKSLA